MANDLVPHPLADLAAQIKAEHLAFVKGFMHALKCGDLLLEAKAKIGHGQWLTWLKDDCGGISERMAQRYMRAAEHRREIENLNPTSMSDLTLTEALKLIGHKDEPTGPPDPQEWIEGAIAKAHLVRDAREEHPDDKAFRAHCSKELKIRGDERNALLGLGKLEEGDLRAVLAKNYSHHFPTIWDMYREGKRKAEERKERKPERKPETPLAVIKKCSFCGNSDVRKLVAGIAAFICDECVTICVDILCRELGEQYALDIRKAVETGALERTEPEAAPEASTSAEVAPASEVPPPPKAPLAAASAAPETPSEAPAPEAPAKGPLERKRAVIARANAIGEHDFADEVEKDEWQILKAEKEIDALEAKQEAAKQEAA